MGANTRWRSMLRWAPTRDAALCALHAVCAVHDIANDGQTRKRYKHKRCRANAADANVNAAHADAGADADSARCRRCTQ